MSDFTFTAREVELIHRCLAGAASPGDTYLPGDVTAFLDAVKRGDAGEAYHLWWDHVVGNTVGEDYAVARSLELRLYDATRVDPYEGRHAS